MRKKENKITFSMVFWVYLKCVFLACLLLLLISILVLYFNLQDNVAKILSLFSMILACSLSGYETADLCNSSKVRNAFLMSLTVAITIIFLGFALNGKIVWSSFHLILLIASIILGTFLGALNQTKGRRHAKRG